MNNNMLNQETALARLKEEVKSHQIDVSGDDLGSIAFRISDMNEDPEKVVDNVLREIVDAEELNTIKQIILNIYRPASVSNARTNENFFSPSSKNAVSRDSEEKAPSFKQQEANSRSKPNWEETISGFEDHSSPYKTERLLNANSYYSGERKSTSSNKGDSHYSPRSSRSFQDELRYESQYFSNEQHGDADDPVEIKTSTLRTKSATEIQFMLEESNKMPPCAERSLYRLICYISSDKMPSYMAEKEFKNLENHLVNEEENGLEVSNNLKQIKTCLRNEKTWKQAEAPLIAILKELCPLNIPELNRLLEIAAEATDALRDKKVILLLGGTGAGKSTSIHYLCGSELVKGTDERGLPHVYPRAIRNEALRKITTSASAKSETKHITVIPLDMNYVICDTPGFEDTNGAEVDIANGRGIVKALHECREVKPVFVMSAVGIGDRSQGLKELAKIIIKIMPQFQDNMSEICYLFTKFTRREAESLPNKFKDVSASLTEEEKRDEAFVKFFDDVLEKLEEGGKYAKFIYNPPDGDPNDVLRDLKTSRYIKDPKTVFSSFITSKSAAVLKDQLMKDKMVIKQALKRGDFNYIEYRLDQLKKLKEAIQDNLTTETYAYCVDEINTEMAKEFNRVKDLFERRILLQNEIIKEDVQDYKRALKNATGAESLRTKHLGKDAVQLGAYVQIMRNCIDQMTKTFTTASDSFQDFALLKSIFIKMRVLSDELSVELISQIPDLGARSLIKILNSKLEDSSKCLKKSMKDENFEVAASELTKLYKITTLLSNWNDKEISYEPFKVIVTDFLSKRTEYLNPFLDPDYPIEKENIKTVKEWCEKLYSLQECFNEPQHPTQEIKETCEFFVKQLQNYSGKLGEKITQELKKNTLADFAKIEAWFTTLAELKATQIVGIRIYPVYSTSLDSICIELREFKRNVQNTMNYFSRDSSVPIDHKKLSEYLVILGQAKWMNKFYEGICDEVSNDIKKQILEYAKSTRESANRINITLNYPERIGLAYGMVARVKNMEPLESVVNGLQKEIESIKNWFTKSGITVLETIQSDYSQKSLDKIRGDEKFEPSFFDPSKAEKSLKFLDACNEIFTTESEKTKHVIESFLKQYFTFIKDKILDYFEKIMEVRINNSSEEQHQVVRMRRIVEKIDDLLYEINQIDRNHPTLTQHYPRGGILKTFGRRLSEGHDFLEAEIEREFGDKKVEKIKSILPVLKVLSNLDDYITTGGKFSALCKGYQNLYHTDITESEKVAMQAFKAFDFSGGVDRLKQLESHNSGKSEKVKRELGAFLEELMDEFRHKAASLTEELPIEVVNINNKSLRILRSIEDIIIPEKYYQRLDLLTECVEEITKIIADRTRRHLEKVRIKLTQGDFTDADKKIQHIRQLNDLLKSTLKKSSLEEMEKMINWYEESIIDELIKKYEILNLDEYQFDPPKNIFLAQNTHPKYGKFEDLKKVILSKFEEELKEPQIFLPLTLDHPSLRKAQVASEYLPDSLKSNVLQRIEDKKNQISARINELVTRSEMIKSSDNLEVIENAITDFEKYSRGDLIEVVLQRLVSNISELYAQMDQKLQENKGKQAFQSVKKLQKFKKVFGSRERFNQLTSTIYSEITGLIHQKFKELCHNLSSVFDKGKPMKGNLSIVVSWMDCFLDYRDFNDELSRMKDKSQWLKNLLPTTFINDVDKLFARITNFMVNNERIFHEKLAKTDRMKDDEKIGSLKKAAENYQKWQVFIDNFKSRCGLENNHVFSGDFQTKLTEKLKEVKQSILDTDFDTSEVNRLQAEQDQVCMNLYYDLQFLTNFKNNDLKLDFDVAAAYEECVTKLTSKIAKVYDTALQSLKSFLERPTASAKEANEFSNCCKVLSSFQEHVKLPVRGGDMNVFEKLVMDRVREIEKDIFEDIESEDIGQDLIEIKSISTIIPSKKQKIDGVLNDILAKYKSKNHRDTEAIPKLAIRIGKERIGKIILSEHKIFEGYMLSLWNQRVQAQDIEYVMRHLEGDGITKNLKEKFAAFDKLYTQLVEEYLDANVNYDKLIGNLRVLVNDAISQKDFTRGEWKGNTFKSIPKILAHIFAIWTLLNSGNFFESKASNKKSYLFKPHPAQVISIFRMLGVGDDKEQLTKNLIEIKTGEGKSVTLAAASCVFALLGYDVSCACYSEYLSQRDERAFKNLFDILNLSDYIHYGTFNKLCEDIINQEGDVRRKVENMIMPNQGANSFGSRNKRPRVLLIDEVDVFFKSDFYGNVYTPFASLKHASINKLVQTIWSKRKNQPLSFEKDIKPEQAYQDCCSAFQGWEELLTEAVKDMISDVCTFEDHGYIVDGDKIGYKDQDKIAYNITYGYKTVFAYLYENERGKISPESLAANVCVQLKCGSYSYAEMPKQFKFITGVTGTLKTLTDFEKNVISKQYGITKYTYIPSVHGQNNGAAFSEDDDVHIKNESDYYMTIIEEINRRLKGADGVSDSRAVLVFFESEKQLMEFRDSPAFSKNRLRNSCLILTEKATNEEKESFVRDATNAGQVSLLTKVFGRGTDFVCNDPTVEQNNGVHVLQTFLSEEVSEYAQIRGRTARQGGRGSYSMVLLDSSLEKFGIKQEEVEALVTRSGQVWSEIRDRYKTIHEFLNNRRNITYSTKSQDNEEYNSTALRMHQASTQFLQKLHDHDTAYVKRYLVQNNKGAEAERVRSRTIVLMDATGSMTNLLHKAKSCVEEMFRRIHDILASNSLADTSFQLQFVVYRNYSSQAEKILEASPWETKPENLRTFMGKIKPSGGQGNEAVEIGLWFANQEAQKNQVSQVILIGDMPPNTPTEVKQRRAAVGESYWEGTKYAKMTTWEEEVKLLKQRNIPVHAFYVDEGAKNAFTEIAALTNGGCEFLDVNSSQGAEKLTNYVNAYILDHVGKQTGKNLGDEYRKKYKMYSN